MLNALKQLRENSNNFGFLRLSFHVFKQGAKKVQTLFEEKPINQLNLLLTFCLLRLVSLGLFEILFDDLLDKWKESVTEQVLTQFELTPDLK